jgi:hypothetical protein
MKQIAILAALALAGCATAPEALTHEEKDVLANRAIEAARASCSARGLDTTSTSPDGCVGRTGLAIFFASLREEEARRMGAAERNRAAWFAAAGALSVAGAGMGGYAAGYSAAQPVYVAPAPIVPFSCQTFGTITRCR